MIGESLNFKIFQIISRAFKYTFFMFALIFFFIFIIFITTNMIMFVNSRNNYIHEPKQYAIVLGASVHGNSLSEMLKARMETAINLYNVKLVKNILMSGDGTANNYSETAAMKKYALKRGVPEEFLITDEKGYNTYATILRAKEVFNVKSAFIISQDFHLTRSVWIAREIGIHADGVSAGNTKGEWYYIVREFFARTKDFFQVIFKVTPYDEIHSSFN